MADFAVPETIISKISLISTRSSPPTTTKNERKNESINYSSNLLLVNHLNFQIQHEHQSIQFLWKN